MTYTELIADINARITTNGSQEITGDILNDILVNTATQINDLTGVLAALNTTNKSNLVAAINEVMSLISAGGILDPVQNGTYLREVILGVGSWKSFTAPTYAKGSTTGHTSLTNIDQLVLAVPEPDVVSGNFYEYTIYVEVVSTSDEVVRLSWSVGGVGSNSFDLTVKAGETSHYQVVRYSAAGIGGIDVALSARLTSAPGGNTDITKTFITISQKN